ncbi:MULTISPECIES: hypothetical protein [Mycobacteroides]|nr:MULTISPECIES: hypothetical protein [Mycobacteroides]MBF9351468.1 hypothetical protein [Mycobacteroides chelonae]
MPVRRPGPGHDLVELGDDLSVVAGAVGAGEFLVLGGHSLDVFLDGVEG